MAAVANENLRANLIYGEIYFVTFDFTRGEYMFWIADSLTGRYYRTETAETISTEWYRCNIPSSFDEEYCDCPRLCLTLFTNMPRNYKRKSSKPPPAEELLHRAVGEVLCGRSTIRKAAEKFNLSSSTVGFYSQRYSTCGLLPSAKIKRQTHSSQIFSSEMESQLAEYLKKCTLINHGLSPKETRVLALSFAVGNGTRIPPTWYKNGQASEDWLSGFLKRNPSLSIRKPEATSQARAAGFNKVVVDAFYDKLHRLLVKYKFKAYQVYNCDETNNPTVMQPPNVIAAKGTKQVQQTVSAERGTNVTMLAFVNAAGGSVPPVFIFPRKKLMAVMFEKGPSGCIGIAHECGWMTGSSFFKSLQHFHSFVKCSKNNPVMLLLDNHASHLDYQAVSFAKDNGIILLTFPTQCSHALQPLDVSVFGPFKRAFGKKQNDWLNRNPGQRIFIKEIAELSNGPYQEAITPKNIIAGFLATGIFPLNRFMIDPSRFAPSFVTDRPFPVDSATTFPNASATSDMKSSFDPSSSVPASSLNPLSSAPASSLDPSSSAPASSLNPSSSAPASSFDPSSSAPDLSFDPSFSAPASSLNPSSSVQASSLNPLSSVPASSLNLDSSTPFRSPLESVAAATSSLDDAIAAPSYLLHSRITPQIGCETMRVSLEEIRPLTQVNQNIPLAKRPRANNRAGSSRILTDTPEKMKIDEENRQKEEKDIKKKERERKKLAPKNIFKPADQKNIEKKARKSKRKENEEETINVNEEDDENCNTQEQNVTQITRTGRIVKKRNITNL